MHHDTDMHQCIWHSCTNALSHSSDLHRVATVIMLFNPKVCHQCQCRHIADTSLSVSLELCRWFTIAAVAWALVHVCGKKTVHRQSRHNVHLLHPAFHLLPHLSVLLHHIHHHPRRGKELCQQTATAMSTHEPTLDMALQSVQYAAKLSNGFCTFS